MMFYQTITNNSKNLREYEILKLKTRRIAHLAQKNFNLISKIESIKEGKIN